MRAQTKFSNKARPSRSTKTVGKTSTATIEDDVGMKQEKVAVISKISRAVELDERDDLGVEPKLDDDVAGANEDGELEDEASLDDEEINPFGDKWEL